MLIFLFHFFVTNNVYILGVTTRVPGWGNPEVVEWLDPTHAYQGSYFKDIANALVQNGYVRNISIRGAPFDFRKGPSKKLFKLNAYRY